MKNTFRFAVASIIVLISGIRHATCDCHEDCTNCTFITDKDGPTGAGDLWRVDADPMTTGPTVFDDCKCSLMNESNNGWVPDGDPIDAVRHKVTASDECSWFGCFRNGQIWGSFRCDGGGTVYYDFTNPQPWTCYPECDESVE